MMSDHGRAPDSTPEAGTPNAAATILRAGESTSAAIVHGSTTVTYGELRRRVQSWATFLPAMGVQVGERVGIVAENGLFFVEAYLGVLRAGSVAVPIQPEASPQAIRGIVDEAGIRMALVSRRCDAKARPGLEALGVMVVAEGASEGEGGEVRALSEPHLRPAPSPPPGEAAAPPTLAALMYTSGSTGAPKGVMVSHRNILANTRDIVDSLGLTSSDRVMVVLPFFYCYGLSLLHTHLAVGGSIVINNQFLYPEQVLRDMIDKGCTGLAGVPSTYQILLRKSRFKQTRFPALRWLQQAGGKLPNPFIREIREAFPEVRFFTMYGQTEATARLSYLAPERVDEKMGSIGKGLPSMHLEVLKEDGSPVAPGSEDVGEIVASGEAVTLGYWNDPDETARYFREGRLFTGDLARVDDDGFIYIVERRREMIKSGGNRVSSKEVEEVIAELPGVVEVAVIGIPDEIMGEAIAAFVVPVRDAHLTVGSVQDHCRRHLPSFKVPTRVQLMEQLPYNASGKVLKTALRTAS